MDVQIGAIRGWRMYKVADNNLWPLVHATETTAPVKLFGVNSVADNYTNPDDAVPTLHDNIGFYAYRSLAEMYRDYGGYATYMDISPYGHRCFPVRHGLPTETVVAAHVELTGMVVEHDHGFRATGLEIVGLYSNRPANYRRGLAYRLGYPKILPMPVTFDPSRVRL